MLSTVNLSVIGHKTPCCGQDAVLTRFSSYIRSITLLLAALVTSGCRQKPLDIVRQQVSPDGAMRAALLVKTHTRTNGSDVYFVSLSRIIDRTQSAVVLETNHGYEIELRWKTAHDLEILSRDSRIDNAAVHYYRLAALGVNVSFSGIPVESIKLRK